MELESLKEMRKALKVCGCDPDECVLCEVPRKVREIADAIQAEVDERYMPLPLDADGVPIRVGDRLYHNELGEIICNGITFYHNTWRVIDEMDFHGEHRIRHAMECRHVKPRTVEDVTNDLANEVICILSSEDDLHISHEQNIAIYEASAKYAAKLQMRGAE